MNPSVETEQREMLWALLASLPHSLGGTWSLVSRLHWVTVRSWQSVCGDGWPMLSGPGEAGSPRGLVEEPPCGSRHNLYLEKEARESWTYHFSSCEFGFHVSEF